MHLVIKRALFAWCRNVHICDSETSPNDGFISAAFLWILDIKERIITVFLGWFPSRVGWGRTCLDNTVYPFCLVGNYQWNGDGCLPLHLCLAESTGSSQCLWEALWPSGLDLVSQVYHSLMWPWLSYFSFLSSTSSPLLLSPELRTLTEPSVLSRWVFPQTWHSFQGWY